MRIIPRSEWGAEPPVKVSKMTDSVIGWIVHYNGPPVSEHLSGAQVMQSIQRYHMHTKGWRDFAYSFGISQDGEIFEGRGWGVVGGHTSGRYLGDPNNPSNNSHAHAVIFLMGQGQTPTQEALDAFAWLVGYGQVHGVPPRTTPHKIAAPALGTSCPGPELTSITKSGYFLDTHKEPHMAAETAIAQLYRDILGREPDAPGLEFWSKAVDSGEWSFEKVRWEFVKTRFAADDARTKAVLAKLSSSSSGGPTVEKVAEEAYRLFLDNLVALAAA